jgi:hypothetical protein
VAFDSARLLNTILDHVLQFLPAEPAASKRLDDIGEAEPDGMEEPQSLESAHPESGVHAVKSGATAPAATTIRAAS